LPAPCYHPETGTTHVITPAEALQLHINRARRIQGFRVEAFLVALSVWAFPRLQLRHCASMMRDQSTTALGLKYEADSIVD
jgi:hypothetical protein